MDVDAIHSLIPVVLRLLLSSESSILWFLAAQHLSFKPRRCRRIFRWNPRWYCLDQRLWTTFKRSRFLIFVEINTFSFNGYEAFPKFFQIAFEYRNKICEIFSRWTLSRVRITEVFIRRRFFYKYIQVRCIQLVVPGTSVTLLTSNLRPTIVVSRISCNIFASSLKVA